MSLNAGVPGAPRALGLPGAPVDPGAGEAIYRALTRPPAPETPAGQLRRYIAERALGPGDRLPSEAELATVLGSTSRLVAREALRALEGVGLVESRAGAGWYVRPFDISTAVVTFAHSLVFHPRALMDLLVTRRAVEADLMPSLAGAIGPADLATLDELVDRMRWRAARGQAFPAEDAAFHRLLLACSGNVVALALADLYLGVIGEMYKRGLPSPEPAALPAIAEAHAAILDALRRGDGGAAAAVLLREHHQPAHQRIVAWQAAHQGDAEPAEAVRAALLWPGPSRL